MKINPGKNTVMLGDAEQLKAEYMLIEEVNPVNKEELLRCPDLSVRIRYRSRPIPCRVFPLEDDRMLVRFLAEASAITPGQSAVFYDGNRVLGGGFIAFQQSVRKLAQEYAENI